jgi:hypothetical protein
LDALELISISKAVHFVGTEDLPVTESAIRKAAHRLGALHLMQSGQLGIDRRTLEWMREFYRLTGWLTPRKNRVEDTTLWGRPALQSGEAA